MQRVSQISRARQHLRAVHHVDNPTDQQIAQHLGLETEKVALYTQVGRGHASLEDPADSEALGGTRAEDDCLADVIRDSSPTAEDTLIEVRRLLQPGDIKGRSLL